MRKHQQDKHEGREQKKWKCYLCDRFYSAASGLYVHAKAMHKKETYKCTKCSAEFSQRANLKKHILSMHDKLKWKCVAPP